MPTEIFGQPIHTYTRKSAIEDGVQVAVPVELSRQAGLRWPVFLTRGVWDKYVVIPEGVRLQDETGRLWDILCMLRFGILRTPNRATDRIEFQLHVRNDNRDRTPPLITLQAQVSATDIDDPAPCITVMLPGED